MAKGDKVLNIQAGRGLAALLVVFCHAGRMVSLEQYVGYDPLAGLFTFGHAGVDFFFVLSGFIIYFVHHRDIGRPANLWHYAWRRITRIYPIYWVVTVAIILLALFSPNGAGDRLDPRHVLASFLLVPHGQDPLLGVGWTLQHEMLFYTVFAVAILSARAGIAIFVLWMALTLYGMAFPLQGYAIRFIADPFHIEFLFGVFAAWITIAFRVSAPRLMAVIGAAAFLVTAAAEDMGYITMSGLAGRWSYGLSAMILLIGLAEAERSGKWQAKGSAVYLGSASYSLYLVHTIVIGLFARTLAVVGIVKDLPGWSVTALAVIVSLIAAALLHGVAEKPIASALNGGARRRRKRTDETALPQSA